MQEPAAGSRAARGAARLLAALAVAMAAAAVALPVAGGHDYLPRLVATPEVAVAVSFSVVGALLAGRAVSRAMGWLLLAIGVSSGLYVCATSYAAHVLGGDQHATLPAGAGLAHAAAWVSTWAWFPAWLLVSTVLPAVVPHGRPLSPRWRWPLVVAAVVLAAGVASFATAPGHLSVFTGVDNGWAVPWLHHLLAPIEALLDPVVLLLVALGLASVVLRFRRAGGVERRQVGWFGYAVALTVLVVAVGPQLVEVTALWVNLAVLLVPAGLAVAALRHRLYDLDLLLNRTLVVGALLAGAALGYVALVAWVGALFGTSEGIVPFVAAFSVALAFHPARIRVQRAVDRIFHGRRGDPLALLADLDRLLREAENPRAALTHAAGLVRRGLRLPAVEVAVPTATGEEFRAASGEPGPATGSIALELHGERVGTLTVATRPGQQQLGDADQRVLVRLAGPIASAAYALRLSGDLEESHRRLLGAREEERRRLRRDLHDGLGPQLAGVVMGLDVVRSTIARGDTDRAAELSGTLTEHARAAVEDVRRLAAGLRPPVLDDLGLVGALRSTGPAVVPDGPSVSISVAGDLDRLPAAVEVAAYRIVQEAMTNAVRHSGADSIAVCLENTGEAVRVSVADDGSGIPAGATGGVGLASMRERAMELGGWCTVTPGEPGTVVLAHLPVVPA